MLVVFQVSVVLVLSFAALVMSFVALVTAFDEESEDFEIIAAVGTFVLSLGLTALSAMALIIVL